MMTRITVALICTLVLCLISVEADTDFEESRVDGTCACGGKRDSPRKDSYSNSDISDETSVKSSSHDSSINHIPVSTSFDGSRQSTKGLSHEERALLQINRNDMVFIEGGAFFMGSDNAIISTDGEGPKRLVTLSDFMIDK